MSVKIIDYDLRSETPDYELIIEKIKSYGSYVQVAKSSFVVETSSSCASIRDSLKEVAEKGDRIFVAELLGNWASINTIDDAKNIKTMKFDK